MMIRFRCPHCGKAVKVGAESAGRKGRCPGCGEIIHVPYATGVIHENVLAVRKDTPLIADAPKQEQSAELPPPQARRLMSVAEHDTFCADEVRRLKKEGCSDDVIRESRKSIPYPAAFREIAIAVRKDIRARRKGNVHTTDLLSKLYDWAVIEDFFSSVEWSQIVNERLLFSTARPFIKAIKTPYEMIGYANLALLNKTDIKWLVEAFGEPAGHSTARDANCDLWQRAVEAFRAGALRDEQHFWRSHGFEGPPS